VPFANKSDFPLEALVEEVVMYLEIRPVLGLSERILTCNVSLRW